MKLFGSRLLSLAVTLTFAISANAKNEDQLIQLTECSSQTMQVRLNHKNKSTKKDLVRSMSVIGDYLDLVVTPVIGAKHEVVLEISPVCMRSNLDDCAYESGWNEVQERALKNNGVKFMCKKVEAQPARQQEAPSPREQQEPTAPGDGQIGEGRSSTSNRLHIPRRRSEGGVTGSN